MELHQLRYFLAVAETGSFTRAAERSFVSQPSLSQQILKLEGEVGQPLFNRLGRRATLTEAGRALEPRARRILREVEDAGRELRDEEAPAGRVVVGAIPSIGPYLVPAFLDRSRTLFPHLEIETYEDFSSWLLEAVRSGEVDFALVGMPVEDDRLATEVLFREPLLLVLPVSHPLAARERIDPADLHRETFILMGEKSTVRYQIDRFLGGHDVEVRVHHRCAQVETMKALVAAGAGVSILPQLVRHASDRRRLAWRPLGGAQRPEREVSLVWHRQRYLTRGARALMGMLRELTADPAPGAAAGGG